VKLSPTFRSAFDLRSPEQKGIDILNICFSKVRCAIGLNNRAHGWRLTGIEGNPVSKYPIIPFEDFHEYVIEWKLKETMNWLIDGKQVYNLSLTTYFMAEENKRLRFLSWIKDENEVQSNNTDWENSLIIDFVEVYAWVDEPKNPIEANEDPVKAIKNPIEANERLVYILIPLSIIITIAHTIAIAIIIIECKKNINSVI